MPLLALLAIFALFRTIALYALLAYLITPLIFLAHFRDLRLKPLALFGSTLIFKTESTCFS